jgi:hypothetical protein
MYHYAYWPLIDNAALSEYDPPSSIFSMAFPWLFPGGVGDFTYIREIKISVQNWAKIVLPYKDAHFVTDKMFCFFVLDIRYFPGTKMMETGLSPTSLRRGRAL